MRYKYKNGQNSPRIIELKNTGSFQAITIKFCAKTAPIVRKPNRKKKSKEIKNKIEAARKDGNVQEKVTVLK